MRIHSFLGAAVAAFMSVPADAAVVVSFPEPERYSDAGDNWQRDENLAGLKRHLEQLGSRYLPTSQTLTIEVLDIDLAGRPRYFPRRGLPDIRVLDGRTDWPMIKLRYTLASEGKTIDTREETVSDSNYLQRSATRPTESLYYEKRMLDEWFRARFVAPRAEAGQRR